MMGLRNPQRGFLGGVSGARPRMAGILSGDQPEIDMGDFPTRPPEFPQAIPQPAPKQRGGLFGKQSGLWKALGAFGDAFSEGPPIYTQQILAQRELEAEEQRRQRERAEGYQDWQRKQEWERANPKPVNNDTVADYEFIRERLGDEAAAEFLKNKANPPQYRVGPDGQFYRIDVAEPPKAPVGRLTPIEETSGSNAAPGFPR